MQKLVELKGIEKRYKLPDGGWHIVLEGIDLAIKEGEFLAVLGPSGSGKSTLLRILAGLLPASSGSVSYLGQEIQGINPGVGMVFQSFALFPWLTVLDNVMLGLADKDMVETEKKAKSMQVLDLVGLDGFENAYPKELSGGMRQRVGIGRALVSEPDILLMDEAFSALDVLTAENLRRDLLGLWMEHKIPTKAIILVTHGIEEAVYMADRAIVLSTGPAKVRAALNIDLPHWRDRKSPDFLAYVDEIYSLMMQGKRDVVVQQSVVKGGFSPLPLISAGALTGFLELLEDLDTTMDLYKLASQFSMDVEDFFPLVEAAELLHFTQTLYGDIDLTVDGKAFARANVLERKDLFRKQLLAYVPFVRQMLHILQSKSNKKMDIAFFIDILSRTLGSETAKKQLDLLIGWERYAELVEYDDRQQSIRLTPVEH